MWCANVVTLPHDVEYDIINKWLHEAIKC
ncbi:protein of unknown function (plasmid) [Azospirillum baldaniorum]|uniref:Uncharacterized protein n=1 Tax=Azospirillum baldaniorum TaxID=1064539 RepID=A0A9P1K1F3_9PROT|nr:protein of unknown function [Azospirillum baldaniorum]